MRESFVLKISFPKKKFRIFLKVEIYCFQKCTNLSHLLPVNLENFFADLMRVCVFACVCVCFFWYHFVNVSAGRTGTKLTLGSLGSFRVILNRLN